MRFSALRESQKTQGTFGGPCMPNEGKRLVMDPLEVSPCLLESLYMCLKLGILAPHPLPDEG